MQARFKILSVTAAAILPQLVHAAESSPATAEATGSSFNPVLICMIALSIVLLFAIAVLGGVLKSVAAAYGNKMRQQKSNAALKTILALVICTGTGVTTFAADGAAAEAVSSTPSIIGGMAATEFYFLAGFIGFELIIIVALVLFIRTIVQLITANPELAASEQAKAALAKAKRIPFWDRFNKSVDIEKEHDIMLDHNYDGIQELDNSLPPWWKYGFYFTILLAVVYIWYYHAGGNGPSSYDEYVAEVQRGEEAKAAYLAKSANNVDENTVKMGDAASISSGANIFQTSCAACHAKDGGGGVGPNLTDDYWLHGGDIKDIFKSVKYGWPDKGMKSWKDDFSPRQLADLASYIKSLKGSKPAAPKEQQGELYVEGSSNDAGKTDQGVVVQ